MAGERKRSTPSQKSTPRGASARKGSAKGRHARPSPPLFSTRKRLATWQKATALVPLALLSGAWTTSMTMTGPSADAAQHAARLPDGTPIPSHPLKKPASVTAPGSVAPAVPNGSADSVAAQSSADGIPSVALAAYQHAARVVDQADPGCRLPWQLLAAIGRVESDHGQYAGNVLGSDGIARPGIYGIPLNGSAGVADISDTDSGRYDGDPLFDRAVGPMQFIPSTWSVVGVDGDGDGVRNPQDINDAALGAAVYLCAGPGDLSTTAGQTAAVYRYNHNRDYVSLVLSIMRSYLDGDYTASPVQAAAPVELGPSPHVAGKHRAAGPQHNQPTQPGGRHRSGGHRTGGGTTQQAGGGTTGSTGGTGGQNGGGSGATSSPSPSPSGSPTSTVTAATGPVVDTISSTTEAVSFCTSHLPDLSSLSSSDQQTVINDCAGKIMGMTTDQAAKAIPDTLTGVLSWLGLSGLLNSLLPSSSPTDGGGILGGLGGVLGGGS